MMSEIVKRCRNTRCNKKFKDQSPHQNREFCGPTCKSTFYDLKPEEYLKDKNVLFMARGQKEDGLHPNERPAIPQGTFRVGTV